MKITILPEKKRIYVKGNLKSQPVEEVLDEIFNEAVHYKIEVEHVYISSSKDLNREVTSTTMPQVGND